MYKNDRPHKASPNIGCPINVSITPSTLSKTTGTINHITYPFCFNIPQFNLIRGQMSSEGSQKFRDIHIKKGGGTPTSSIKGSQ